jgi:uncharacterized membrane protein YoaK (UPF0700 family)
MYLFLGFALGTFVSGLIAKFYGKESSWIPSSFLFVLSGLFVLVAPFLD